MLRSGFPPENALGDSPDYFELRTLPDGRIHKIIEITNTTVLNIYDTFQISK